MGTSSRPSAIGGGGARRARKDQFDPSQHCTALQCTPGRRQLASFPSILQHLVSALCPTLLYSHSASHLSHARSLVPDRPPLRRTHQKPSGRSHVIVIAAAQVLRSNRPRTRRGPLFGPAQTSWTPAGSSQAQSLRVAPACDKPLPVVIVVHHLRLTGIDFARARSATFT